MESPKSPTSDATPALPFSPGLLFAALRGETTLDLTTVPADKAPLLRQILLDMKEDATRNISALLNQLDDEFLGRIDRANGAIPTPLGAIEAEPVYTAYAFNVEKLKAAQPLLPPKEAKKLVTHVPEQTIPAHDEPGNSRSIGALRDKYHGSEVARLLSEGMTRGQTGRKIKWPKVVSIEPDPPLEQLAS